MWLVNIKAVQHQLDTLWLPFTHINTHSQQLYRNTHSSPLHFHRHWLFVIRPSCTAKNKSGKKKTSLLHLCNDLCFALYLCVVELLIGLVDFTEGFVLWLPISQVAEASKKCFSWEALKVFRGRTSKLQDPEVQKHVTLYNIWTENSRLCYSNFVWIVLFFDKKE